MNLILVAVRDRALEAFMRPFWMQTEGQAIRSFQDEVNRAEKDNPLNAHPDDYDLYVIGRFNDVDGSFVSDVRKIADGKQVRITTH